MSGQSGGAQGGASAGGATSSGGTMTAGSAGSAAHGGGAATGAGGTGAVSGIGGVGPAGGAGGSAAQGGAGMGGVGGSAAQGGTETGGTGGSPPDGFPEPATAEELCDYLQSVPPPAFDPAELVTWWDAFVSDHPDRSHGTASNLSASEHLRDELNAAGYTATIREFSSAPGTVRVVEGIKAGTELADQHVGITAHYDIVTSTTFAAYDNGSGVAAGLEICKQLAQVDTRKSIACLFFDAEELGAFGSLEYVDEVVQSGELSFDQVFGYDMVGLNYPAMPWKLYAFLGLDTVPLRPLVPAHSGLLNSTLFDCLGDTLDVSDNGFELISTNERNSDEAIFTLEADIPAVRFAGGRSASDYNGYHNEMDTVENVYDLAGSRADFENGMAMVVNVSYYSILAFDLYDPFEVPDL